jgi:fucose permease
MNMTKSSNRLFLIAATYGIMLMFGFAENLKGMAIPPIRKEFNINFSTIGFMVLCASLGYLFACLIGGAACEKFGQKRVLSAGYIVLIFATVAMSVASQFWMVCLFMFLMFTGMGLFEAGCNVLAGQIFTKNTAIMMNLLHLFYGIGAIVGPKFAAMLLLRGFSWKQYYLFAAAIIAIFFVLMLATKFPPQVVIEEHMKLSIKQVLSSKTLWILGIALGFGVTLELGTGNWLVNYLSVEYSMNVARTSFYMSMFYVTFVFGRLFGGFIVEKLGYLKCIIFFSICTLVLYIAAAFLKMNGAILISAAGFFISIIFPTAMAIVVREYKHGTGTVIGFIIAVSAVVNMIFNWIIGKTNDIFGVYIGFNSFIIYAVISIILFAIFGWMRRTIDTAKLSDV